MGTLWSFSTWNDYWLRARLDLLEYSIIRNLGPYSLRGINSQRSDTGHPRRWRHAGWLHRPHLLAPPDYARDDRVHRRFPPDDGHNHGVARSLQTADTLALRPRPPHQASADSAQVGHSAQPQSACQRHDGHGRGDYSVGGGHGGDPAVPGDESLGVPGDELGGQLGGPDASPVLGRGSQAQGVLQQGADGHIRACRRRHRGSQAGLRLAKWHRSLTNRLYQ